MYFTQDFIDFFKELAGHNHKDWFDDNRKRYTTSIKEPFENFVGDLIIATQKIDKTIEPAAKDCIFRINKDIRFSKDKTPYKTDRSAIVSKKGRKDKEYPGNYIRLSADGCSIGGGAYYLQKDNLLFTREKIAQNTKKWEEIINDKNFASHFPSGIEGEKNKVLPKELREAAASCDYIFNKQFYYMSEHPSDIILRKDLVNYCVEHFQAALEVKNYIAEIFES